MNLLLSISIFWVLSEIILAKLMRAKDAEDNYDKSSLKILWITICFSTTIGILISNSNFVLTQKYTTFVYNSGISLICIGLIIRWIAILKLKKSFTVNLSVSENQIIVQTGIYKKIRHPSYLDSLLSFFGFGLVFNNWFTLTIIFIPILFSFIYRIRIEEKLLSQIFGIQYTNYIENSWKLVPRVF